MTTPRVLRPERSTLGRYRGLREGMCWLVVASLVGGSVLLSCGGRSSEHRAPSGTAGSEVTGAGAMAGQAVGSEAGGGATAGGGASTPCSEDASDGGCPEGCDSSSDVDCGLQPGLSCTRDQECQSQSCVGGVCCQEACGACQVCSDDGLSCSPVPYRQTWESEGESCSGDRWCDGLGACRPKVQVSGNDSNTCVLLETGDVRCWGDAQWGQLGYGSVETVGDDEVPAAVAPIQLGALALEVAVGGAHACALLLDGNVRCWGRNFEGRLGSGPPKVLSGENIGDDEHPDSFGPVSLGARAKQVVAGDQHTCALLLDGNVRCWGYDASGQAGYVRNGGLSSFPEPPSVAGNVDVGGSVTQLCAGRFHTCAVLSDGNVRCWGDNVKGQLGYDRADNVGDDETPASAGDVSLPGPARQVTAGYSHTCALLVDQTVFCWGKVGGQNNQPPSLVDLSGPVVDIAAGQNHTCALLDGGDLRCWGNNTFGELGYGHTDGLVPSSAGKVPLGGSAVKVAVGGTHTCALLTGGALRCWGDNGAGQLGYGHTKNIGDDETPASAGDVQYQ